ncbi:MAG TPA: HD domain-containing phosphohydrolase [Actinomycetota bacterium]|nr:HD domain-containing phosphohydrolase [Actinomycetota bacterium]
MGKRMSTRTYGASAVEAAAQESVKHLRRSAGVSNTALYRPHPDGYYVPWINEGAQGAALPPRIWWDGEEGWLWADDGRYLVSPLGEEGRIALGVTGPWTDEVTERVRANIEKAVRRATNDLAEAVTAERIEAARQHQAVERSVADLLPNSRQGLVSLVDRAIQAEIIADAVVVESGALTIEEHAAEQDPAVEVLQRALRELRRSNEPVEVIRPRVIDAMAEAVDARAEHTMGHSERVMRFAVETAQELGWDEDRVRKVGVAARLHDVGNGFCGREALIKARLADAEREAIRRHAELGATILHHAGYDPDIVAGVRGHHERWDGAGYPDGLREEEIPHIARIVALVEVYDAMVSRRPWREALPTEAALEQIVEGSATQFAPDVVDAFLSARWRLDPDGQRALASFWQPGAPA